jgi:rhomboid family GlyGly-CTERM serine protease
VPVAIVLALASLAAALAPALAGERAAGWLMYQRDAVLAGQVWRLISAHVVHLGWMHGTLNLAALALVAALLGRACSTRGWAALTLVSALGVGLGLLVFSPQVAWYVGLSGVIHGLVAAGGVVQARARSTSGLLWLAGLVAKLAWEQWQGPVAGSETLLGGATVVDAHLYGALAGAAGAWLLPTRLEAVHQRE